MCAPFLPKRCQLRRRKNAEPIGGRRRARRGIRDRVKHECAQFLRGVICG
jgi:hypothetical protein